MCLVFKIDALEMQNVKPMSFIQESVIHVLLVSGLLIQPHSRLVNLIFQSSETRDVGGGWVEEREDSGGHSDQPQEVTADVEKDTQNSFKLKKAVILEHNSGLLRWSYLLSLTSL